MEVVGFAVEARSGYTLTAPAGTQAGDLLLLARIGSGNVGTPSTANWTKRTQSPSGLPSGEHWERVASGTSADSIVLPVGGTNNTTYSMVAVRESGDVVARSGPYATFSVTGGGSIPGVAGGGPVLAWVAIQQGYFEPTWGATPAGWTLLQDHSTFWSTNYQKVRWYRRDDAPDPSADLLIPATASSGIPTEWGQQIRFAGDGDLSMVV